MSMFGGGVFDLVRAKMAFSAQRQNILAQNIANASTPGFVPSDMKEGAFGTFLAGATAAAAGPAGPGGNTVTLKGSFAGQVSPRMVDVKADGETTPDGNGVNLERQMMKMAENGIEYQQATNLYRKAITLWRTALGSRGGI